MISCGDNFQGISLAPELTKKREDYMVMSLTRTAAVLLLACSFSAFGEPGTSSITAITDRGEFTETTNGEYAPAAELQPVYDPPEVLWHYTLTTGGQQKMAPMGFTSNYVFTGGWYGGAKMFKGSEGDGSILWSYEPAGSWTSLGTGTVAAKTADIFYAIQNWDNGKGANTAIHCFTGGSATPVWTYDGTGTFDSGSVDGPGKYACSTDGSVLAVGGAIGGHLAIQFFSSSSSVPISTYEDEALAYYPRQLRVTADGSKCIFRCAATLYRVDTATGTLEASFALDASNDCFGVSPDGSVVAYGFTAARIAVWDGSAYNLEAGMAVSGYYGGAAAVAADNSTVYFGFYKSNYTTNRIIRYDLDASTPVWTYDYPVGSGGYQDVMEWMECSSDGRWLVAGSWGCQNGGGNEVNVFDDLNPGVPVFSIDTPGSIFHVDISDDGRYVSAAGKHVHANEMGSGTDVYMGEVDIMGVEEGSSLPSQLMICPNPSSGTFTADFTAPEPCTASMELFDLSGRLVHSSLHRVDGHGAFSMEVSTGLPPGIYTCRLSAAGAESTVRLVITR